jgi:hypothetical protein
MSAMAVDKEAEEAERVDCSTMTGELIGTSNSVLLRASNLKGTFPLFVSPSRLEFISPQSFPVSQGFISAVVITHSASVLGSHVSVSLGFNNETGF